MLVNRLMKNGKKALAFKIVYQAMRLIGEKTNKIDSNIRKCYFKC